jgi:hypothetical protein
MEVEWYRSQPRRRSVAHVFVCPVRWSESRSDCIISTRGYDFREGQGCVKRLLLQKRVRDRRRDLKSG